MMPRPPAFETAAASAGVTAPPIGARTIGTSIPRSSVKAVRTTSFSHRGRRAGQRHAALPVSLLRGERLAGLEQRLHAAEDDHPPHVAGNRGRRLRRTLELVVDDRQLREASVLRLDLPRHAAGLLRPQLVVPERAPRMAQTSWRIGFEDFSVHEELLAVGRPALVSRA